MALERQNMPIGKASAGGVHAFAPLLGLVGMVAAIALAGGGAVPAAAADEADLANVPVRERRHSLYDPIGIHASAFHFFPRITAGVMFDSNVFASASDPSSDFALVLAPELRAFADRGDGFYEFSVGAKNYTYHRFDSEDRTDAHARFRGSKQLRSDIKWDAVLEAARRHQLRGDSFTPTTAAEPIPFNDLRAETAVTKTFNRLGVMVGGRVRHISYENVTAIGGGTLDQSYRDGTILTTTVKPSYEFSPGYRAYTRIDLSQRDYKGTGAENRDSQGYDIRGGVEFRITPLMSGSVDVGYLAQDYDNPAIPTVEGVSAGARMMWLMTPLMTLSLFAERSVAETAAPDQEARLDLSAGAQLDYEIMRSLILSLEGSYKNEDFVGTARTDDVMKISTKIDYLMSRSFNIGMSYSYFDRLSNDPLYNFDKHVVTINVTAQH
jgi:hypothetical protein